MDIKMKDLGCAWCQGIYRVIGTEDQSYYKHYGFLLKCDKCGDEKHLRVEYKFIYYKKPSIK